MIGFAVKLPIAFISVLFLSSCAATEGQLTSRAVVEVRTHGGVGCAPDDLKRASAMAAAFATLERGYGGYMVVAQGPASEFIEVGEGQPEVGSTRGAGEPEDYVQLIMILHTADPDFAKATDARKELGPQWSSILRRGFLVPCGTT